MSHLSDDEGYVLYNENINHYSDDDSFYYTDEEKDEILKQLRIRELDEKLETPHEVMWQIHESLLSVILSCGDSESRTVEEWKNKVRVPLVTGDYLRYERETINSGVLQLIDYNPFSKEPEEVNNTVEKPVIKSSKKKSGPRPNTNRSVAKTVDITLARIEGCYIKALPIKLLTAAHKLEIEDDPENPHYSVRDCMEKIIELVNSDKKYIQYYNEIPYLMRSVLGISVKPLSNVDRTFIKAKAVVCIERIRCDNERVSEMNLCKWLINKFLNRTDLLSLTPPTTDKLTGKYKNYVY